MMTDQTTPAPKIEILLPCPFCGASECLEWDSANDSIYCRQCDMIGPNAKSPSHRPGIEAEAIAAWNQRHSPDAPLGASADTTAGEPVSGKLPNALAEELQRRVGNAREWLFYHSPGMHSMHSVIRDLLRELADLSQPAEDAQASAEALAVSHAQGYAAGIEDAARVAETYWVEVDYNLVGIADADMAMELCRQSAAAIRNLASTGEG